MINFIDEVNEVIDGETCPQWTKANVQQFLDLETQLRMHVIDRFEDWWEEENNKPIFKSPTPKTETAIHGATENLKEFYDGFTDNFENFYRFDYKNKEWVITHYGKEYRFPEDWLYENAENDPDLKMVRSYGYWDGPTSGLAKYNGENVWFSMSSDRWDYPVWGARTFELFRLSHEQHEQIVEAMDSVTPTVRESYDHARDKINVITNTLDYLVTVTIDQFDYSEYGRR